MVPTPTDIVPRFRLAAVRAAYRVLLHRYAPIRHAVNSSRPFALEVHTCMPARDVPDMNLPQDHWRNRMTWNRREFLQAAAAGLSTGLLDHASAAQTADSTIRAVAFDGFVIFDPRPVFALAERLFPRQGCRAQQRLAHAPVRVPMAVRAVAPLSRFRAGD